MKNDGTTSFLDLVLCAVACTLFFYIVQIAAPRAPGRDDKPLVIQGIVTPSDTTKNHQFVWRLVGPDDRPVAANSPPGTACRPADLKTKRLEPFLVLLPEASYGRWKLFILPQFDSADNRLTLSETAEAAGPWTGSNASAWRGFFHAYSRYLELTGTNTVSTETSRQLEQEIGAINPLVLATYTRGGGERFPDLRLATYIEYRQLCFRAALVEVALRDKQKGSPEYETIEQQKQAIDGEIDALLTRLRDLPLEPIETVDPDNFKQHALLLGIEADNESRLGQPGKGWKALAASWAKVGGIPLQTTWDSSEEYWLSLSELIRWRGILEYKPPTDPADQPNATIIHDTLVKGRSDPLLQFLRQEYRLLFSRRNQVDIDLGVAWGDQTWPDGGKGHDARPPRYNGVIHLDVSDLQRPVPIMEIELRSAEDGPTVELSPRVERRAESP
ncbi:MAG TPA: hypothetical protein VHY91_27065 [Pirellulales bacterium]|jgi:hypothetical protein|nr:hypothetical protein [Pirellulales bacterium]